MGYFDQWHDWVRLCVFVISVVCLIKLSMRYHINGKDWNTKTLDYWYALVMWCAAGVVLTAQGVYLNRPFTPGTVFVTAAALVTLRGLARKGEWGGK